MSKISKKRIKNTSQTILFSFYSFFAIFFYVTYRCEKNFGTKKELTGDTYSLYSPYSPLNQQLKLERSMA